MEGIQKTHEQFVEGVKNHLSERENCPTLIIVHTSHGLEIQTNFMDFAMQMGMLDIAKMSTAIAFDQQARKGYENGENKMMVSNIQDAIDPDKKKVN